MNGVLFIVLHKNWVCDINRKFNMILQDSDMRFFKGDNAFISENRPDHQANLLPTFGIKSLKDLVLITVLACSS